MRPRHRLVGSLVIEQRQDLADDPPAIGSHQLGGPRCNTFRPFGGFTHDEHRLAERGRFLLNPTAVRQDQMAQVEQPDEMGIVERLYHRDVRQSAKDAFHDRAHVGIGVNRKDHRYVRTCRNVSDGPGDRLHPAAEILSPMAGDSNDALSRKALCQLIEARRERRHGYNPFARREQRIDHGVAGDMDACCIAIFTQQGIGGRARRREVHVGDTSHNPPVHLFRPWMIDIATAQARFDMGDRDFAIIGGKARHHGGQGVAMHDDAVRLFCIECLAQIDDQLGRKAIQRLVRRHHVQVDVRLDTGNLENLVEQTPMLRRHDHAHIDMIARP